jgi:release factor glutamine methyltransferase
MGHHVTLSAVNLGTALHAAIEELEAHDVGSPRLNAETLLMFTLGCDRAYLYAHPERGLTADEAERYASAIAERARGRPSQYITGHQEFWGLDFIVTPAVLIPRPETEHSVEMVLELAKARAAEALQIADIGTGSGCIALALAHELPNAEIEACDISTDALEIARLNAERLDLSKRVHFRQSDLLSDFSGAEKYDFIVCNPPYVSELKPETVQRQVREYEPKIAVFSGKSGLEIYERLIPQARAHLNPGGWLVMEIGFSIENEVRSLLAGWPEIVVKPDLQGIPRVLAARL